MKHRIYSFPWTAKGKQIHKQFTEGVLGAQATRPSEGEEAAAANTQPPAAVHEYADAEPGQTGLLYWRVKQVWELTCPGVAQTWGLRKRSHGRLPGPWSR